jgi:penicillin-binding protein 1A
MAQAYSAIAADGILRPANFISKIVGPTGKVLYRADPATAGRRVLTSQVARTEQQMLTGVLKNGTAAGLSIGRPAAGKTGTTDLKADAWFIGFTPQLTTAVWMGDPNGETPMTNVGGIAVFGATYPAHIWAAFMQAALAKEPVVDFIQPVESLWPAPARIDEFGRHVYYSSPGPVVTAAPTTLAPVVTTTLPFTPPTVPPTTTPPTSPTGPPGQKKKGH